MGRAGPSDSRRIDDGEHQSDPRRGQDQGASGPQWTARRRRERPQPGWNHYLGRLAVAAIGGDAGPTAATRVRLDSAQVHRSLPVDDEESPMTTGTKDDPWVLATPPGSSEYTMYRDEDADPPALVCQVGSDHPRATTCGPSRICTRWLLARSDWVPLGRRTRRRSLGRGYRRGVGSVTGQSGRRLVRPAEGVPGPLRHVPAPRSSRGPRPGRGDP